MFFVGILEVTDEKSKIRSRIRSQIRIRKSSVRIQGSGSLPVPKCHGSGTLVSTVSRGHPSLAVTNWGGRAVTVIPNYLACNGKPLRCCFTMLLIVLPRSFINLLSSFFWLSSESSFSFSFVVEACGGRVLLESWTPGRESGLVPTHSRLLPQDC
jgi:hypothetical protein